MLSIAVGEAGRGLMWVDSRLVDIMLIIGVKPVRVT
jgi:hypothetical protein